MPSYQHDMMHCSQKECKLKDTCYRYWLGKELKNHDYQYASFYMPQNKEAIGDKCVYYIKKEYYG